MCGLTVNYAILCHQFMAEEGAVKGAWFCLASVTGSHGMGWVCQEGNNQLMITADSEFVFEMAATIILLHLFALQVIYVSGVLLLLIPSLKSQIFVEFEKDITQL